MSDERYTIKYKEVKRTGIACSEWVFGSGYQQHKGTVRSKKWCVLDEGKIIAECRSKSYALQIASALNLRDSFFLWR